MGILKKTTNSKSESSSPTIPEKQAGMSLPKEILSGLKKRTKQVLQEKGILTCGAFLDLKREDIVGNNNKDVYAWWEITNAKPKAIEYLSAFQGFPSNNQNKLLPSEEQESSPFFKSSSPTIPEKQADRSLLEEILSGLRKRTKQVLKEKRIITCEAFLALKREDIVGYNYDVYAWQEIVNSKPRVAKYLSTSQAFSRDNENGQLSSGEQEPAPFLESSNTTVQKKQAERSLPKEILSGLRKRTKQVLQEKGIITCEAFLNLKRKDIVGDNNKDVYAWWEIKTCKPKAIEYLSSFQGFSSDNQNELLSSDEQEIAVTLPEKTKIITPDKGKQLELTHVGIDPLLVEKLTNVLSAHFSNGYRLNSPIEMTRFRSFAAEDLDKEIALTNEELKNYIAACGTTFNGKVHIVSVQTKERIKGIAEGYFTGGAQAIFFAEFYAKNENWLFEANVVSEDMLIDILHQLFQKLSFTQTYFGYTKASVFSVLEGEILRVWGDNMLMTYAQLAERLQYIPLERIKSALAQNGDFIWSSVETFSHVSRIEITDEERGAISEAALRGCNTLGYASIPDLPLGEIEERNYELSITAIHNAVYRICLSDEFDKNSKIITRKGEVLDALTIMKEYCRTIDKCSLDDLLTYEKELTGEVHRWIPMEAANTVLVRINKNTYVTDRYVHFNADMIDEAIGLFVKGEYLPLKSFTTFGVFPDCGQTWNLFLLESYCRRFSRKFRFDTLIVNSRNAGAVIRKGCSMGYTEIITNAVAYADVPLKDTAVSKFLYENGYTGRHTTAKINEIIDKAKAIREKRD